MSFNNINMRQTPTQQEDHVAGNVVPEGDSFDGFDAQVREADGQKIIKPINATDWLESKPPEPDQILEDTFDRGDKLAIIGSSKLRKSFFLLMMLSSLATGKTFLHWNVPQKRKVLLVQYEISEAHMHRRFKTMCKALQITRKELEDRFLIINARGKGLSGVEGIRQILEIAKTYQPEVIAFDPLYKLQEGGENAAEDMKGILSAFDELANETEASIVYVHHDAKGNPGDRDIRDRGSGSNVLSRDYDACFTLTSHSQDEDAAVVDILLRNYRPQDPFVIRWIDDEGDGYRFDTAYDLFPEKKTSKSKASPVALSTYLPIAESILDGKEMLLGEFKTAFKKKSGLSDTKIREFMNWSEAGGNPPIVRREEKGRGKNNVWIKQNIKSG